MSSYVSSRSWARWSQRWGSTRWSFSQGGSEMSLTPLSLIEDTEAILIKNERLAISTGLVTRLTASASPGKVGLMSLVNSSFDLRVGYTCPRIGSPPQFQHLGVHESGEVGADGGGQWGGPTGVDAKARGGVDLFVKAPGGHLTAPSHMPDCLRRWCVLVASLTTAITEGQQGWVPYRSACIWMLGACEWKTSLSMWTVEVWKTRKTILAKSVGKCECVWVEDDCSMQ